MLGSTQRLRRTDEFTVALRRGRRAQLGSVVVHMGAQSGPRTTARAGFVVPKKVGPAVCRNKVRRRLRHLTRELLPGLPVATDLVVRALPGAAERSFAQLRGDLEGAVRAAQLPRSSRQRKSGD